MYVANYVCNHYSVHIVTFTINYALIQVIITEFSMLLKILVVDIQAKCLTTTWDLLPVLSLMTTISLLQKYWK